MAGWQTFALLAGAGFGLGLLYQISENLYKIHDTLKRIEGKNNG